MSDALARIIANRAAETPPASTAISPTEVIARALRQAGTTIERLKEDAEDDVDEVKSRVEFVPDTVEFRRILALPRRTLDQKAEELASAFTEVFSKGRCDDPTCEFCKLDRPGIVFRPIQALALHDIHQHHGLFGPQRVGAGKTITTYMAPEILDAKRPLLIIPAKLKQKTLREFRRLHAHLRGPNPDAYRIVSYELLGRPQAGGDVEAAKAGLLERYSPDLIVLDEAHKVANKQAAVTKRITRFLAAHPGIPVVALSGTMTKRSLKDYAHIARWCMPNMCPLPTVYKDLEAWADALDEKTNIWFKRPDPGALLRLCDEDEAKEPDRITAARRAFRRRVVETPGCVATQDGALGVSLSISAWEPLYQDPKIEAHFETLRASWETPDGWTFSDSKELWRHARELALGFYYKWDPRPPDHWSEPRRAWGKFCREVLKYNKKGWDSESQVVMAVKKGVLDDGGLYRAWAEIKKTFTPNTVPVWESMEAIESAAKWAQDNHGIIWVEHVSFGEKLSEFAQIPFYQDKGLDKNRKYIEDHPKNKPLIASVLSNSEGRNLQHNWSSNLIMAAPPNGRLWEQLLGRTHRDGQAADEVTCHVFTGCWEHVSGFWQARRDAEYAQATQGQAQKLVYADVEFPLLWDVETRGGYRWTKPSA